MNYANILKLAIFLSCLSINTLGKLVEDDPNLDSFSRDLFNSANFDISKDNYEIIDFEVLFNLSTLTDEVRKTTLKFDSLAFNEQDSLIFKYPYFRSVLFYNGVDVTMQFGGFTAQGDPIQQIYVQLVHLDLDQELSLLRFDTVKEVIFEELSFFYSYWANFPALFITNVENVQFKLISFNYQMNTQRGLFMLKNSNIVTIDKLEITKNKNLQLLDLNNLQNLIISHLNIEFNEFNQHPQYLLYLYQVAQVALTDVYITSNIFLKAKGFTLIFVEETQYLKLYKAIIKNNSALQSFSSFQILRTTKISFVSVFCSDNTHVGEYGGTMLIDSQGQDKSVIEIKDSIFRNNRCATSGGGLYMNSETISISHSKFIKNTSEFNGGALYIENVQNFEIENSLFQENSALENGGAISFQSNSYTNDFKVTLSTFQSNYAQYGNGGALYSIFFNSIMFESSNFTSNKAFLGDGGALFTRNTYLFQAQDSNFQNNLANKGGVLRMDLSSFFLSRNSTFYKNSANFTGGAIYLLTVQLTSQMQNTDFIENTAVQGGALYGYSIQDLQFDKCKFDRNYAEKNGGAIFFASSTQVILLKNSQILQNIALGFGGGIYGNIIRFNAEGTCKIQNNSAYIGGGIAYLSLIETENPNPKISTICTSNKAVLYGPDLASLPSSIKLESVNYFDEEGQTLSPLPFQKLVDETQSYLVTNVKSESTLVLIWKLKSGEETLNPLNVAKNDINDIVEIKSQSIYENEYNLIQKKALTNRTLTQGDYFTSTFFIIGQPTLNFLTQFSFIAGISDLSQPINIDFHFRDCQIGEIYVQDSFKICYQCKTGTYSFTDPNQSNATCDHKPDQVYKSYGSTWIMKSNYWRSSQYSSEIIKCIQDDSCIGGSGYGDGLCSSGFEGMLCDTCVFNNNMKYTQNLFDSECTNCEDKKNVNVFQIIVLCFYIVMISFTVVHYLIIDQTHNKLAETLIKMKIFIMDRRQTERRQLIVYIKMLLHFCQISICLSFFQISTLNTSANLFVLPKYFSDTITVIIQLSTCFFTPSTALNDYSIFFTQLIFIELLPLAFFLFGLLLLYIFKYKKVLNNQEFQFYSRNFFWFCFVGLFSLSIIRNLGALVACSHIGSQKRMYGDLNIDCESNTTRTVLIFSFASPIFASLCAFLPLRLLQIMFRSPFKKDQLLQQMLDPSSEKRNSSKEKQKIELNEGIITEKSQNNQLGAESCSDAQSANNLNQINPINCASLTVSAFSDDKKQSKSKMNFDYIRIEFDDDDDDNADSDNKEEFKQNEIGVKQVEGINVSLLAKKSGDKLTEKTLNQMNYSYLTIGYKVIYWELVRFLFRQVVIVIMMFFNEIASFGGSLCIVIYLAYLYFIHKLKPFSTGQLNSLEKEGTFIQAASLFSFVIIGQINGDYRFYFLADVLCFFVYVMFFWFLFKLFFLIAVSICENHSRIDEVKSLFNKIIPNTFKINHPKSLKKWKLIQNNLKVIIERRFDEKLFDKQFILHQNRNLLKDNQVQKSTQDQEIENLDCSNLSKSL